MNYLIWAVTAVYALVAVGKGYQGDWNDCLIFGGYTLANMGVLKVIL